VKREVINSEKAFPAVGPYSHAVLVDGRTLFTSGSIGACPIDGRLKEGLEAQVEQALPNLAAVLDEAGMSFDNVVKTTVFLRDMNDFPRANEIYARCFPSDPPARSTVAAAGLPLDALYEVEAIAVKST